MTHADIFAPFTVPRVEYHSADRYFATLRIRRSNGDEVDFFIERHSGVGLSEQLKNLAQRINEIAFEVDLRSVADAP